MQGPAWPPEEAFKGKLRYHARLSYTAILLVLALCDSLVLDQPAVSLSRHFGQSSWHSPRAGLAVVSSKLSSLLVSSDKHTKECLVFTGEAVTREMLGNLTIHPSTAQPHSSTLSPKIRFTGGRK